jgi:hypothetical protein
MRGREKPVPHVNDVSERTSKITAQCTDVLDWHARIQIVESRPRSNNLARLEGPVSTFRASPIAHTELLKMPRGPICLTQTL